MLKPFVNFSPAGDFIQLGHTGRTVKNPKHERGKVQGFSIRSRSRLMAKISQLRKHQMPLCVTLTYPSIFPEDFQQFKYHLDKFVTYLRRRLPGCGLIWKLEFQHRGAAHFHLLLWGVSLHRARRLIPLLWFKIAGSGDVKHYHFHLGLLKNQHCVQEVRSWHGVKSYASKYFAKLDERTENSGRFWGIRGSVPFSPLLTMRIDINTALAFRRAFRRHSGMTFKRFGFWAYGYHVDWLKLIDFLEDEICKSDPDPNKPPWRYSMTTSPALDDLDHF